MSEAPSTPEVSPEEAARNQQLFNQLGGRLTPDEIRMVLAKRSEAAIKADPEKEALRSALKQFVALADEIRRIL